jgi:photosystem II stability/assembly factor-like uncharacterized protein
LVFVCLLVAPPTRAEPDVLVRPSLASPHASRSVILAVTRAGRRLVAAGERGIILLSDDDGGSWQQAPVPVSVSLTGLHFPTDSQGWAVGHSGVVLHSVNGGATWTKQMDGIRAAEVVLDAARAAVHGGASDARLLRAERLVRDGPDKPFLDVYFADQRRGFVVGAYGLFLATRDGGATWRAWDDHVDNPEGKHFYSLRPSGRALFLAGEQGALYRSLDGGETFGSLAAPVEVTYFGVIPGARGTTLLFGLRGNVFWSSDAGETWRRAGVVTTATLTAGLCLDDASSVLVTDQGDVLRSTGPGRDFLAVSAAHAFPFTGVVQAADRSLILSGSRGLMRVSARDWGAPP